MNVCQNSWGPSTLSLKAKGNTTKMKTETVFLAFKPQWGKDEFALPVPTLSSGQLTQTHVYLLNKQPTGRGQITHCSLGETSWAGNKSFKKKQRGIRLSLGNKSASVSEIIT